jgi:enoyl-CoA hydratase/carnithine racemase
MNLETLSLLQEGKILYVSLNRPEKRNAMNLQMFQDLEECMTKVAAKSDVGAVIIQGEGKAFSSGTDLTELAGLAQQGADIHDFRASVRKLQRAFSEIEHLEKAVIATIHGYALGAAFELMLACDLRIASEEARFSIPEVNLGIIPDLGGSHRLSRIVGVGRAKELILTGKMISAAEAERIGLINKVVPLEQLRDTARACAEDILNKRQLAVGLAKRTLDMNFPLSTPEGLELAGIMQSLLISGGNFRQGITQKDA